jgi:hypothetical protein
MMLVIVIDTYIVLDITVYTLTMLFDRVLSIHLMVR